MWQKIKVAFHKLGSPAYFYGFSGRLLPWLWIAFGGLAAWGLYQALFVVPPDYQQGDSYRILFIHVPSAWQAMMTYVTMSVLAVITLVWRIRIAEIMAMVSAPIGAAFTLICLTTGALWGKPTWGTYWAWDARLTSMLVLLFIYLGIMGLYAAFEDRRKGARVASVLILVGLVNIPIIHFSVEWWTTLHQGATIRLFGESTMDPSMIEPLIYMTIATKVLYAALLLMRSRTELADQDRRRAWVRQRVAGSTARG